MEVVYLDSLWNLLSFRRFALLSQHGQDAFDQLGESFKTPIKYEDLTECKKENSLNKTKDRSLIDIICKGKRLVNQKNLYSLLNVIFKFIVYKLISLNEEDEDYNELNLKDVIEEIIDEPIYNNSEDKVDLNEYNLNNVKVKNIEHIWKLLVNIYSETKNN